MVGGDKKTSRHFFAKKMANEDVSLLFTLLLLRLAASGNRKSSSLKTEGFLPCHGVMQ